MTAFPWTMLLVGRAAAGEPTVAVLSVTGSAGVGAMAVPDVGVRAALVPTFGGSALEVGVGAARSLPVRLAGGGSVHVAQVSGSARFGPDIAGGSVRIRPAIGLSVGGLGVQGAWVVRLVVPEVAVAVEREALHLALTAGVPLTRMSFSRSDDGGLREVGREPALRIGLELGVVIPLSGER